MTPMRLKLYESSRRPNSSIRLSQDLMTGRIAQVRLGTNLAVQVSVECIFLVQRFQWSSNTLQVIRSWLKMITLIAAVTVLRRSRLGTMFRSGLRRPLEGAQRLGRALNPHSMILTLTDCVDLDISTSTRTANVIPPIPLPYTAIPFVDPGQANV